jgi:hypothetical protein
MWREGGGKPPLTGTSYFIRALMQDYKDNFQRIAIGARNRPTLRIREDNAL